VPGQKPLEKVDGAWREAKIPGVSNCLWASRELRANHIWRHVRYFAYATRCVGISDAATLRKVEQLVESCQHCNPEGAEIPFDTILDRVTSSDPSVTDYVLEVPGKCPNFGVR
jgi:hypothetical protein